MSEISELAAKYARQLAGVEDLYHTSKLAQDNAAREQYELNITAQKLKDILTKECPRLLIPIGHRRHVLVHGTSSGFGVYASIEIITEETM